MVILLLPKGYCLGSIHLLSMACPQLLALCRMMHGVLPFVWHPCLPLSWIILSSRGCPWDFLNQQSLWCLRGLRGIVCRALQDPLCTQPSALCPLWALHMNLVLFPDKAKFSSVCCWQPDTFPFLSFRVMDLKNGIMLFIEGAELIYLTPVALHSSERSCCVCRAAKS